MNGKGVGVGGSLYKRVPALSLFHTWRSCEEEHCRFQKKNKLEYMQHHVGSRRPALFGYHVVIFTAEIVK